MQPSKVQYLLLFGATALLGVLASQASSYLVNRSMAEGQTLMLNAVVWLTHVRNHGGIFAWLPGKGWLFAVYAFCVMAGVTVYLFRAKLQALYYYLCLGLIVGGGTSNILDRLIYGSVVDFINIQGIPYWNYIFNTADVLIHLGIWPMLLLAFLEKNKPAAPPAGV